MNTTQARQLVAETFPKRFDEVRFLVFIRNLLHEIDESKAGAWNTTYIKAAFKEHVKSYKRLGTYTSPEKDKVDVLVVHLTTAFKLERARTAIRNFVADHLKTRDNKDAALVAFVSPTEGQWRFSYVKMEYAAVQKSGGNVGVQTKLTPARRSSYIVGEGESCHTAQSRFLELLQDTENHPTLAQIENAFSVEAVTREFFEEYKGLFLDLKDEVDELVKRSLRLRSEFQDKDLGTADFAKKLMGQIVFLYFLQKKGWLGVPKGKDWGEGPRDFLRRLWLGRFGGFKNFFDEVLEPLFYDTLATDRGHEAWCQAFQCRIPFLNGGLFEPLRDYDWRKTAILVPNSFFSNAKTGEGGDVGTGILDVFDRYNFTVNEAEPLELEVAIDPEMLGKVFENLLEVTERKSKGSFYTPRPIVNFMCQESLINYLDTFTSGAGLPHEGTSEGEAEVSDLGGGGTPGGRLGRNAVLTRADIATLVHSGDQASHYENARVDGTSYARSLPKSIEAHARLLDEGLRDLVVCDPAIGSGAFPVGMMQEIVRTRSALTPYFNDVGERTAYHFKRHAIQNCLYGVDIDPGAVEIAKLRLWLSLVVDEDDVGHIKPLPNLDYKIVVGNSLLGVKKTLFNTEQLKRLEELKPLYFDATARRQKDRFKREIDGLIHELTLGKNTFDFEIHFSEVFHRKGGFDVLIANPPYGRLLSGPDEEEVGKRFPEFRDTKDAYVAFALKALALTVKGGTLSYIVPTAWLGGPNYLSLRSYLLTKSINAIVVLPFDMFEAAYVDTLVLLVQDKPNPPDSLVRAFTYPKRANLREFRPGPWELLSQSDWERIADRKFLLTKSMIDLATKFQAECLRTLGDVIDMKRGVLFDRSLLSKKKHGVNSLPYFEGDVYRYQLNLVAPNWVEFGPEMKERPRDIGWFKGPRLLLRRLVNRQRRLMATFATESFITNKNLYSILPKKRAPSLHALLGILNSSLLSRLYLDAVSGATKDDFPQVTITDILRLPLPTTIDDSDEEELSVLVHRILASKEGDSGADVSALERELDDLVFAIYKLTPQERALVDGSAERMRT